MIKVQYLEQTCIACPVQFEGYDAEGNYLYIRERGRTLRVDHIEHMNTILRVENVNDELDPLVMIKEYTEGILDFSEAVVDEMPEIMYDEQATINWLASLKDK